MKLSKIGTFLCLLACGITAQGTTINIDARASGAQPGPRQTFWHDPFNAVSLSLAAGTYDFQLVDPAIDSSATYTAWSYNSPFITNYLVFLSTDLTHELFSGAVSDAVIRTTAQAAFDATVASGNDKTTFTFATPVTLLFAVPDNLLSDNQAGVSVLVQPSGVLPTPEPASAALFASGVAAILLASLLRARRTV